VLISPEDPAGRGIERHGRVGRLGEIHHAVDDERRRLEALERLRLKYPLELETGRVARLDLAQRAVPLARVASRVREPVLRLARRAQQALVAHVGARDEGREERERNGQCDWLQFAPFSDNRYATTSARSFSSNTFANDGMVAVLPTEYS